MASPGPDPALHEPIRKRWSPLAFAEKTLEPEKLRLLLEAARWSPSSFNEQPWRFVLARREETEGFQRLLGCLVEGNRQWAHRASALLLSVAKLAFDRTGKENRHAFHDVGLAAENLVIQATAMGLHVHQMAGFDVEKARTELGIPAGFEPVAMIAVGYHGDPRSLPEKLRAREEAPRTRKPLQEIAFGGRFGNPAPLTASGG